MDAAKETVLATRAQLVDIENAVLLNAVNAYLSVRRSEAFVELRENNVRLLTQQLRATRDRFEVGEVTLVFGNSGVGEVTIELAAACEAVGTPTESPFPEAAAFATKTVDGCASPTRVTPPH